MSDLLKIDVYNENDRFNAFKLPSNTSIWKENFGSIDRRHDIKGRKYRKNVKQEFGLFF